MSSTSSIWSTSRRSRRSCVWRNRRGDNRWDISPFPFPFISFRRWMRHSSSCLMVELAIHLTKSTLNALGNPSKALKSSSPTKKILLRHLSTTQNDKRKEKEKKVLKRPGPLFRSMCPVFGTRYDRSQTHMSDFRTRVWHWHADRACRTRLCNISWIRTRVSDAYHSVSRKQDTQRTEKTPVPL